MVKHYTSLILVTALLLLSSAVIAQSSGNPGNSMEADLDDGVLAYNFVMQGLPASNEEEVDVERSFENEADENESFSISEQEAVQTALEELGSRKWDLGDAEQSEGLYELTFARGESEAEVSVDGSTGRIVEFEAEVEYEPQEESSAVLSGFVRFANSRYNADTDIEVDEESNEAFFEVEIEEEGDVGADVINRQDIREVEDAEPGEYTGTLEVTRDGEVVHTEKQDFRVPGPVSEEDSEEDEDTESEETEETEDEGVEVEDEEASDTEETEESSEGLEGMSRDELVGEVRSLRAEVSRLESELEDSRDERDETGSEEESESDSVEDDFETEDEEENSTERQNDSDESSIQEDSDETTASPGSSENRPGFVNRLLSGLMN